MSKICLKDEIHWLKQLIEARGDMAFEQHDVDNAIDSILEELENQNPWNDIKDAPRDGTSILIYNDDWNVAIVASSERAMCCDESGADVWCDGWAFDDAINIGNHDDGILVYEDDPMPTKWQFLRKD